MRMFLMCATALGTLSFVAQPAYAQEQPSVTVSASVDSAYIFPRQAFLVDDEASLYHAGISYEHDSWSLAVDGYRYGEDGALEEIDATFSTSASCGMFTCGLTLAWWRTPTEDIGDVQLSIGGGDLVTWELIYEHQEGETYATDIGALELATELLALDLSGGISYDADADGSQVYGRVERPFEFGGLSITPAIYGYQPLDGDRDSAFAFGVSTAYTF
ncbi:MAG TPA: hypothetical protein VEB18_04200 [Candidatus Paceibacterota bacterium]|nr:hypothetical protein [Candidatus Paceibacterota bacterium]